MGISIIGTPTHFELGEKEFYFPHITDSYHMHRLQVPYVLEEMMYETGMYFDFFNDFDDPYFDETYFEFYRTKTQVFLDKVKEYQSKNKHRRKTKLVKWLLEQKGNMVGYHDGMFWSAPYGENITKQVWTYSKPAGLNEDCRLISSAIGNMSYLYGIDLKGLEISADWVHSYDPEIIVRVKRILEIDVIQKALVAEEQVKTIQKREDDEFFEERLERFKLVLEAAKKGARILYAV